MRKRIGFLAIILFGLLAFSSCAGIFSEIRLAQDFKRLGIDFGDKDSILKLEQGLNFEYWTKWKPINMLMTKEEKKIVKDILKIEDVAERNTKAEKFIQWFWLKRDDNTYDNINEFKDNLYGRVIEAQTKFANDESVYTRRCAYGKGHETDMGLIYILLGESSYPPATQDVDFLMSLMNGVFPNTALFPDKIEVWYYDVPLDYRGTIFDEGIVWILFERDSGYWKFGDKTFSLFYNYENYYEQQLFGNFMSLSSGQYRGEIERFLQAVAESYIYDNELTFEDFLKK